MGTIPPSLPPMHGGQIGPQEPTNAELARQFKALWDAWFNNPNVQTATALLDYITAHKGQIEAIANKNPSIMALGFANTPIGQALSTATQYLSNWIDEEKSHPPANTIGTSEMIKDVYDWISYVK